MFDNNGRRIYTDFRELAEAKRQEAYEQMRRGAAAVREAGSIEEYPHTDHRTSSFINDDSGGIIEAKHRNFGGGAFRNKTKDESFFVTGESSDTSGSYAILVQPEKSSPVGFDADFFKCNDKWYKISLFTSYVTGGNGHYSPHNFSRPAKPGEAAGCEDLLHEYWKRREQIRYAGGGDIV